MNTFVHLLTNIPLISAHRPTRSLSFGFSCNSLLCVIRERWVYVERVQTLPPTGLSPVLLPHAPYWLWRAAAPECKSAHGTGGWISASCVEIQAGCHRGRRALVKTTGSSLKVGGEVKMIELDKHNLYCLLHQQIWCKCVWRITITTRFMKFSEENGSGAYRQCYSKWVWQSHVWFQDHIFYNQSRPGFWVWVQTLLKIWSLMFLFL